MSFATLNELVAFVSSISVIKPGFWVEYGDEMNGASIQLIGRTWHTAGMTDGWDWGNSHSSLSDALSELQSMAALAQ